MTKNIQKGFASLMIVIMVSGIISTILFSTLLESYFAESNILDRELKESSKFSAKSCIAAVAILFAEFGEFSEQTLEGAGVPNCTIHGVEVVDGTRIVEVESAVEKFHTFLRAKINVQTNKIISLEEVKSL